MSKMISNPEVYFGQFIPERSDSLMGIEAGAGCKVISIVGPVVGEFLFLLIRAIRANKILELGISKRYSATYLANTCLSSSEARVVAVEKNPKLARRAQINF